MRLTNPIPASWLAIEQATDGKWSVVRCYPGTLKVTTLKTGITNPEAAARWCKKQKKAFGHNGDVE